MSNKKLENTFHQQNEIKVCLTKNQKMLLKLAPTEGNKKKSQRIFGNQEVNRKGNKFVGKFCAFLFCNI